MQSKKTLKKAAVQLCSVAFWLLVWQIGAALANRNLLLKIPLPLDTLRAFCINLTSADFWLAVGTSLFHIISGFLLALIFGTLCGILAGNSDFFKSLSAPLFHLMRSVPVAAFIIIAWLWVPAQTLPVFISFLMVFPIIKSHIDAGLATADRRLVEMAQVHGKSGRWIVKNIKIPSVLPHLREAAITGLSIGWKAGVAAEVICNPSGSLGALLSSAKSSIDYEQVFAVTLTVIILSLVLENVLKVLWREQRR